MIGREFRKWAKCQSKKAEDSKLPQSKSKKNNGSLPALVYSENKGSQ